MFHLRHFVTTSSRKSSCIYKTSQLITQSSGKLAKFSTQIKSNPKDSLIISDSCIKRLKELKSVNPNKRLRVLVDSGGCSGFEYKFSLDTELKSEDLIIEKEGCEIIVDEASLPYLKGATVDHYEELIRTGFRIINNPNSEQGCSCGSSFSIKI